ncbi:MAG: glycosyltransferase [Actinomycetota bacterium]|nr:glycosyltransferase [Actinomycetota bacterium]
MILAVVVPFLNEREYLPEFLESLAAQTRLPDRLVLVDDGSTDGSHEPAAEFAAGHDWAHLLRRPEHGPELDRLATAKELEAFQWAVGKLDVPWDVVGKLDGDLRLTPRTLETLLAELERDERLGLVGSYLQENGQRIRIGEGHVHGATKFFRRRCYEEVQPIPPILGWDTIDEFTARMRGWRTQSFAMPDGDPEHLRPRGTYDGLLRGYRRWGACSYALGESPAHVALYALRQMATERPPVAGGASYVAGYAGAALRRVPRADPKLRAQVRREQKQKIKARILRIP